MKKMITLVLTLAALLPARFGAHAQSGTLPEGGIEVAEVLSAFPVGFSMLVENGRQYIAYYDAQHQMTLAARELDSDKWEYKTLPSKVGWDSHNSIAMAFDKKGYLHVVGNIHASPLVYFRASKPYDIQSLEGIHHMTGAEETRTTYPHFMRDGKGEMIFHYRSGGSGNGFEVYNIYDPDTKTWSRLLDKPLTDGLGERNAYMQGPTLAGDGYYHLIWVWRETPDCSTNHTLSYARSRDLLHWETVRGEKTALPITLDKKEFYVDDTPVKGGLFNPGIKLGFDSKNRPVIGYHKYDENGNNQLYVTRFENGKWKRVQLTDWTYRWQFEGNGSMKNELSITNPVLIGDGRMAFGYDHIKEGVGQIIFDEETLRPVGKRPVPERYPAEYGVVTSSFPNMRTSVMYDGTYLLRWETLPTNRDRRPEGELPPPSKLMLYKLK